ncbi:hypothetical protein M0D21_10290 [Aquimarina sp. D1M17]|uniref:hypothetical protein n=1 Tax=Aquimarina acroporae TaxID=2937283 RepID=UPI0020C04F3C|nr:hypothetical protein [Aquimarina acroporae]MCK8521957.1 hypothetical protein [Aquimarina acroporae]
MKHFIIIIIFSAFCLGNAQQIFETGKIIDSIPISKEAKESFALYLPSTYTQNTLSSIVFIFEPAARSKIGIQAFVEASEKYNYILVCSNNTRNGPYQRNFEITNRLFDYIFSNFNVAEDRILLAGFSGGARLATSIAVLTDQIAGVIACGAAFSENQSHVPSIQKFAFVGMCGDEDMNYTEMILARHYLEKFNFSQALFTYSGDHSWPPPEEILKAFEWLEIQAHIKNIKRRTDKEIYRSYQGSYQDASLSVSKNNLIEAIEDYDRLISTYESFYEMDSIKSNIRQIKSSKAYKSIFRSFSKAFDAEAKLTEKFRKQFYKDYVNPKQSDMNWWKRELNALKESKDPEMNKMIKRLRFKIFALAYSMNNPNLNQPNTAQKEFCIKINKIIYPEFKR